MPQKTPLINGVDIEEIPEINYILNYIHLLTTKDKNLRKKIQLFFFFLYSSRLLNHTQCLRCDLPSARRTHAGQHQRQTAAVQHLQTVRLQAEQVNWLCGSDAANLLNVQPGTHGRMMRDQVLLRLASILPSTETSWH